MFNAISNVTQNAQKMLRKQMQNFVTMVLLTFFFVLIYRFILSLLLLLIKKSHLDLNCYICSISIYFLFTFIHCIFINSFEVNTSITMNIFLSFFFPIETPIHTCTRTHNSKVICFKFTQVNGR